MRLDLSADHRLLRQMVRDFVSAEVTPHAAGWEMGLPDGLLAEVAALGLLGVLIPEAHGGAGMDPLAFAIAVEELAVGDGGLALVVASHAACAEHLLEAGRTEMLGALASGDRVGAWGDDLVPSRATVVCGATLGTAGPAERTHGVRSARLGPKTAGEPMAPSDRARDLAMLGVAALAVGVGRAGLEHGARYALERKQFGTPIANFQASQWKVADGATDLDAARLLVHRAAGDLPAASMALSFATSAARRATDDAIQLHGGYGYTREYPVERFWRDAKYCQIALGGQRAHRLDVARRVIDRLG